MEFSRQDGVPGELRHRSARPPDYQKENQALLALARAMVHPESNILQTLAETILELIECDSAGLSLLSQDGTRFYWPAIAGEWKPYSGGGTPRNFAPSAEVLARDCPLLFRHFERQYPNLLPMAPAADECLMVPIYVGGQAVGTIWAILHSGRRGFDPEDERLLTSLSQFASLAHHALASSAASRDLAKQLEAKVRRLVDANIMGIVFWNIEGRIEEANQAFFEMLQYTRDDLVSGSVRWNDLTPEEWRSRDQQAGEALRSSGAVQPYEKELFRKDGSRIPVLVGSALFENSGYDGVAFVLDLTEARQAQGALRTVEQHARSIVDNALDAVVSMNGNGIITDWNKRAEEIFGWQRAEAVGRRMSETIIPMQHRLAHERGLHYFFTTGEGAVLNRRIEITAIDRNGREFPVELTVTPLKSGDTWTFSSFIRDISDRKRSEERLRASELHLRRMTETIPEMLWSATPEGAVDYCNARVLDYTGLAKEEVAGAGWMAAVHSGDVDNMARAWTHAVRSGTQFQFEFRCRRASDGAYRWCVSSALPLRTDESVLKWYGTIVDFHDRRQAQESLRDTQAELAHVNRVMTMGELAASIAHEVNQPLAAIIASGDSCTAWLASEPPNLERARAAAGRVIQAATQASETVQRIRALFKKSTTSTSPVNVNAVIEETVSLLRHETQRHGIALRTELDERVPVVIADRIQLQQVILNLAMNAIESTAGVDREPREVLLQSALSNAEELLVSVRDTGPGIDAAPADRLFAPFFTTKPEGIGMGLPISRTIIEAHGGRLWAEKNQPRGAAFHFTLPTPSPIGRPTE